jgi:hypothetical protein
VVTFGTGRATTADPTAVSDRDDVASFIDGVLADFAAGGAGEWENSTLERFLDGLAAVAHARLSGLDAASQEVATWQPFAHLVAAATGCE